MKTMIVFDLKSYGKNCRFLLLVLALLSFGIFGGSTARFTLSENLAYNSPYQIAFITAFLSLSSLFFSTLFSAQLALKEIDYNLNHIYFSLPISKKQFLWSRFVSIFILSFGFTFLLTLSFFIGRELSSVGMKSVAFNLTYYLIPLLLFSAINTFFVVVITTVVAWSTKNKLFVYVSGLLLYVFYMVSLLFSSSPFMANQLPQSKNAQLLSAIFDPFGLSAFFYQTAHQTIVQRNSVITAGGILLTNRIGILFISVVLLILITRNFSVSRKVKSSKVKQIASEGVLNLPFEFVSTEKSVYVNLLSFFSFVKMNGTYILKSIPFVLIVLSLLFAVGMEMYAEIEKGIRLPQKYASSGLMVSTIIQNFYVLGALVLVFYANDLYWRSKNSNFHFIEECTANYTLKFWSIWLTLIIFSVVFTLVLILEGIVFQWLYNYPIIEWKVYAKTFLFTTFPLILVSGFALLLQKILRNKYLALAVSGVFVLVMTTTLGKVIIKYPLLKFLQTISFDYSDMNGFGRYENVFQQRLFFGFVIVLFLMYLMHQSKKAIRTFSFWIIVFFGIGFASYLGQQLISEYIPKDRDKAEMQQVHYEKQFRIFQSKPQPSITNVTTRVDLFPSQNAYAIKGNYVLENKTSQSIDEILFNFSDDFSIKNAVLHTENGPILVKNQYQIIRLKKNLLPSQKLTLDFELLYQWKPVNGHQSFNAIVENGSFMRISRNYPLIGYLASKEIEEKSVRKRYNLGERTLVKPLDAPKIPNNDFISLDMIVSTEANQTAIGVGELTKQWKESNRNVFQFKTDAIPFRFAISSANYAMKKERYNGKIVEVYYHPTHHENVFHLIKNAKFTMDYCEANFGKYPFKTIRFAEISGFTQGFNATAYPATIFMNENMSFHCNILADKKQDVINELAGHELAHLWWGNSQIDPDAREGDAMLTETLAMYTELMLLKKMYGKQKVEETVAIHQDIFESEKGFSGDIPLLKVTGNLTHIAYSKGAVAMYKLSELIGEDKVNKALRSFLNTNRYPNMKPSSTDFLKEVYQVSDTKHHETIKSLFEK
ncbi:aminopeptidase [Flavobacterium amnicola]|uniref:Aminopeptidase n=1 Tax=Flavobacterium amnicola TaxID=2506422 RepID=A0A4Q1K2J0_9FLAO|nr:M1 family aminopeptidase [Flavobacterium amnicola]RXR19155.1 aminopeptidase [Flavobacterium amnicola]